MSWLRELRRLFRGCAEPLLGIEPLLAASRRARLRGKIVVLMYHEVAPDAGGTDAWTVVRESAFARQMGYIKDRFRIVGLLEAVEEMRRGGPEEPTLVVTFDDGYRGNNKVVLPIVEDHRIPVTVFVATGFVEDQSLYWYDRLIGALNASPTGRYDFRSLGLRSYEMRRAGSAASWSEKERLLRDLKRLSPSERESVLAAILAVIQPFGPVASAVAPLSIEEVRELARHPLVTIGAHSHCHNLLTQLSAEAMHATVRRSKELLESWTGRGVLCFAYPNGDRDAGVVRAVQELGFICAVTTRPSAWAADDPLFEIPRVSVGRYDSLPLFKAKASGVLRHREH